MEKEIIVKQGQTWEHIDSGTNVYVMRVYPEENRVNVSTMVGNRNCPLDCFLPTHTRIFKKLEK